MSWNKNDSTKGNIKSAKNAKTACLGSNLVLFSYLLHLFGVSSLDMLSENDLKDSENEGIGPEGHSYYYELLANDILYKRRKISREKLLEYDENILRHTRALGRDIVWKYFQYLALLFCEIYLDKYFSDKEGLKEELNIFLAKFSEGGKTSTALSPYKLEDLNKIAMFCATGSGKTLLMHVNLLQMRHYAKGKFNNTLLITPNEGLSHQHLAEYGASHISATLFDKNAGLLTGEISVIEITKLGEEAGEKTVALSSFGADNLVFVDEGHRGSSGDVWKKNRDALSSCGFAFEYSATFAQAIAAQGTGRAMLLEEYGKSIAFDYSYKHFYNDGYGKEFGILNLKSDEASVRELYLTGALLGFYEQLLFYNENRALVKELMIEAPLMVFVGGSVNAVRKEGGKEVSDVVYALLFLDSFLKEGGRFALHIKAILSHDSGLKNADGSDIFANRFSYLLKSEVYKRGEVAIYNNMLRLVFNHEGLGFDALELGSSNIEVESKFDSTALAGTGAGILGGHLMLTLLKSADGEIALRSHHNDYFGVINVGDSKRLADLCEGSGLEVRDDPFLGSMFYEINKKGSKLKMLIGSKKFSEGWSSWRVSSMGLLNVGKKEGSQIIQLFGRGVRLKGKGFCLKRSSALGMQDFGQETCESLNIFGICANYMKEFREYLEVEGLSVGEMVKIELPVTYKRAKSEYEALHIVALEKGKKDAFKKEEYRKLALEPKLAPVKLSLYVDVDSLDSASTGGTKLEKNKEVIAKKALALLNFERLYFGMLAYKKMMRYDNLAIGKEALSSLLASSDWYTLYAPKDSLRLDDCKALTRLENTMLSLLRLYIKAFYERERAIYENEYLRLSTLHEDASNLIDKYEVMVDKSSQVFARVSEIKDVLCERGCLKPFAQEDFSVFSIKPHIYSPLLYKAKDLRTLRIMPVELNDGEQKFCHDLDAHISALEARCKDMQVYLLRNQSKKGVGLFAGGNFYPDFIMWIKYKGVEYITFIDPKGLLNLDVQESGKIKLAKEIKVLERELNSKLALQVRGAVGAKVDAGANSSAGGFKAGDGSCPHIVLNSFIISVTSYKDLRAQVGLPRSHYDENHVLFIEEGGYVGKMFGMILGGTLSSF